MPNRKDGSYLVRFLGVFLSWFLGNEPGLFVGYVPVVLIEKPKRVLLSEISR